MVDSGLHCYLVHPWLLVVVLAFLYVCSGHPQHDRESGSFVYMSLSACESLQPHGGAIQACAGCVDVHDANALWIDAWPSVVESPNLPIEKSTVGRRIRLLGDQINLHHSHGHSHAHNPLLSSDSKDNKYSHPLGYSYDIHGVAVWGVPNDGSVALQNDVQGRIVLLRRGNVPFSDLAATAYNAGAIALVIVDNGLCNENLECGSWLRDTKESYPRIWGFGARDPMKGFTFWRIFPIPVILISSESGKRLNSIMAVRRITIPGGAEPHLYTVLPPNAPMPVLPEDLTDNQGSSSHPSNDAKEDNKDPSKKKQAPRRHGRHTRNGFVQPAQFETVSAPISSQRDRYRRDEL